MIPKRLFLHFSALASVYFGMIGMVDAGKYEVKHKEDLPFVMLCPYPKADGISTGVIIPPHLRWAWYYSPPSRHDDTLRRAEDLLATHPEIKQLHVTGETEDYTNLYCQNIPSTVLTPMLVKQSDELP